MTEDYKNYLRLKIVNKKLVMQVCEISWHGSHTPVSTWKTIKTLNSSIILVDLDKEISSIRNDTRYFSKCRECDKYSVIGHMQSDGYCQGCASSCLDIVY